MGVNVMCVFESHVCVCKSCVCELCVCVSECDLCERGMCMCKTASCVCVCVREREGVLSVCALCVLEAVLLRKDFPDCQAVLSVNV